MGNIKKKFDADIEDKYAESQVIHDPRQVRTPGELQVGETYLEVDKKGNRRRIRVIANPSPDNPKCFRIKSEGIFAFEKDKYYADLGLVPYDFGGWNPWNYILPDEDSQTGERK